MKALLPSGLTLLALLAGCTSSSEYRESQVYEWGRGTGVHHEQIDEHTYKIVASGRASTSEEVLLGWIVRRGVELCGSRKVSLDLEFGRTALHRSSTSNAYPDKWQAATVTCDSAGT